MTNHVVRLYAGALALLAFFLVWAVVAARPWAPTGESDPRMAALERRELALKRETRQVNRTVKRRFAVYERRLKRRQERIAEVRAAAAAVAPSTAGAPAAPAASAPAAAAAPPAVAVTPAPPVTSTGSS
jgi:hypothetical protein